MPGALDGETSPYLLRYAGDPVDWLPWGEEARRRAHEEDRPLLVTTGDATCEPCRVMARECFADPAIAAVMNAGFVCVLVDRDERPDLDAIHADAVRAMTGRDGSPTNVFLTPDGVPFFGGTFFGPQPRDGVPGWPQILDAVLQAWGDRRAEILEQGPRMVARLGGGAGLRPSPEPLDPGVFDRVVRALRRDHDSVDGGWGRAPKVPPSATIELLLDLGETTMSVPTLHAMAGGGINDQIGGGLHTHSLDASWTVPRFEKRVGENALLARAYLHGWQTSGDPVLRRTCEETLGWALRDMRGPEGAFRAGLDAEGEDGRRGAVFLWTLDELRDALGADAEAAIWWFGATAEGNLGDPDPRRAGLNVLESRGPEPKGAVRERIRARLREVREARPGPWVDERRFTASNALMVGALAAAGAALGRADLVDAATTAADAVLRELRDDEGRLRRVWTPGGGARHPAVLEDHAFLLCALLDLHDATADPRWSAEARAVADIVLARFADPHAGGFFSTADDHEPLVARRKDMEDGTRPSGASAATLGLLRLARLTGDERDEAAAVGHLRLVHTLAVEHPWSFAHLLRALHLHLTARDPVGTTP